MKRDAIEENHCLIQQSPFDECNFFSVLATPWVPDWSLECDCDISWSYSLIIISECDSIITDSLYKIKQIKCAFCDITIKLSLGVKCTCVFTNQTDPENLLRPYCHLEK